MPTTIDSAGITFNDATSLTSANIGTAQLVNGSVTAAKLGTTEQKQIAKAWVNFDGTTSPGTIRSSYNVSSITKNGTGDYTVNFTTAMTDANYSVSGCVNSYGNSSSSGSVTIASSGSSSPAITKATSAMRVLTGSPGSVNVEDKTEVSIQIFGN